MKKTTLTASKGKRTLASVCTVALAAFMAIGMTACGTPAANNNSQDGDAAALNSNATAENAFTNTSASSSDEIAVNVTLTEDVAGANLQETALQFAEEEMTVNVLEGSSALEALQATGREVATESVGTDGGREVVSIGGLGNGDAGEGSHWTYTLNGVEQTDLPSDCIVSNGDTLVWTFVH